MIQISYNKEINAERERERERERGREREKNRLGKLDMNKL